MNTAERGSCSRLAAGAVVTTSIRRAMVRTWEWRSAGPILVLRLDKAQYPTAIYVLVCFSATCPVLGHPIQIIHCEKVVRYRARLARGVMYMEAKYGYWNC